MNIFPKISVVTPCFNMASYIEGTIKSVLSQNYRNLEYIIIDGGSTDGTTEIINRYKNRLCYFVSEPDNGMYDAIMKGFSKATGDVFCWLNADDSYFPWTLHTIGELFGRYPDVQWAIGQQSYMYNERFLCRIYNYPCAYSTIGLQKGWYQKGMYGALQQESMFWRRELFEKVGGINLKYRLAADFDLWTRFAQHTKLTTVSLPLASFLYRKDSLSHGQEEPFLNEINDRWNELGHTYPNFLYRLLGKNMPINYILRLITWRKTPLFFYSDKRRAWILRYTTRSIANNTLSALINEWKFNK